MAGGLDAIKKGEESEGDQFKYPETITRRISGKTGDGDCFVAISPTAEKKIDGNGNLRSGG